MDEISCVNDYLFTITCTVRISKGSDHIRNISYWLEFQHYGKIFNCSLAKILDNYQCTLQSPERFIDTEHFVIKLWDNLRTAMLENRYKPAKHIKPVAPCNLSVHWFPGGYNFTWQNSYEKIQPRVFLIRYLKYRLWYYRSGDSDDVTKIELFEKLVQVEDLRLEPDTEYIAKVSSSPISNHYCGQWSDWSPAVRWRTYKRQGNGALLLVGLAACAAIAIMLFLFFRLKPRLNLKKYFSVPTPEPFFQSLYNKYKGDFKSWVMSQGNLGRPLNIEEPLKLDTLVVAPPIDHKESYILPPLQHTQTYTTYVNPLVNTYGIDPQDSLFSVPFLMPELSVIVGSVLKHTGPDVGDSRFGDLQCSTGYSNNYCTLTATGNELIPSKAPEEDCDGTLQFTKL
ncbi:interleukin-21 receptor isoform X2 [Paramormyrops kingsleyae]|nr:interleukin-21 receptor-like isoform X2 [Paramormyrops kingsleyae]XP_023647457.1 interleukin-21 receptor-like isoform X2 [Paramormyrops kingsleyae]XP_023647458.1 interleukin-21 receptor-like isoform X2 [Paramormyrops kingsleyae]XP_023647459.1 interleukin-21 receptor-like isoform X2 [Paramormyrops kingsleyae]XP_023647460.1 interleukin-21 receptor-like isoform X2 [Paramormyrops kingsleyae]